MAQSDLSADETAVLRELGGPHAHSRASLAQGLRMGELEVQEILGRLEARGLLNQGSAFYEVTPRSAMSVPLLSPEGARLAAALRQQSQP